MTKPTSSFSKKYRCVVGSSQCMDCREAQCFGNNPPAKSQQDD
jgi:hypothetical protein